MPHAILPKTLEDGQTKMILSVDKSTGIIAVDPMWVCLKCSYAYNRKAMNNCDNCKTPRSPEAMRPMTKNNPSTASGSLRLSQRDKKSRQTLESDSQRFNVGQLNGNSRKSITVQRHSLSRDEDAVWTCSACTLENASDRQLCLACDASRQGPHERFGATASTQQNSLRMTHSSSWSCSRCTLDNEGSSDLCVMCEAPRVQQKDILRCSACTFENKEKCLICEMCGNVLNNKAVVPPTSKSISKGQASGQQRGERRHETRVESAATTRSVKQESELMEELRVIEEQEAKQLFQNIVQFCLEVRRVVTQNRLPCKCCDGRAVCTVLRSRQDFAVFHLAYSLFAEQRAVCR